MGPPKLAYFKIGGETGPFTVPHPLNPYRGEEGVRAFIQKYPRPDLRQAFYVFLRFMKVPKEEINDLIVSASRELN